MLDSSPYWGPLFNFKEGKDNEVYFNNKKLDTIGFGYIFNFIRNPYFEGLRDLASPDELAREYTVADGLVMFHVKNEVMDYLRAALKEQDIGDDTIEILRVVEDLGRPIDCPLAQFALDAAVWRWVYGRPFGGGPGLDSIISHYLRNIAGSDYRHEFMEKVRVGINKMLTVGLRVRGVYWMWGEEPTLIVRGSNQAECSQWRYTLQMTSDAGRWSTTSDGKRMRPEDPARARGCLYHHYRYADEEGDGDWETRQPLEEWSTLGTTSETEG